MLRIALTLPLLLAAQPAFAQKPKSPQDRIRELQRRISALERENKSLRQQLQRLKEGRKKPDAKNKDVARIVVRDDKRLLGTIVVTGKNWGGSPKSVAALCASVAREIFRVMPPKPGREPTILVVRSRQGPMTLYKRGANGEYTILLNSGDRRWAQLSYQFAHEMGHALAGALDPRSPQMWFEESFCEALSIWTMLKMGETWKTKAPFDNWRSYAPSLTKYARSVRDTAKLPDDTSAWYAKHRKLFNRNSYDRAKNRVLARMILNEARKNEKFITAFSYMRPKAKKITNSMEWVLVNWKKNCPRELQFAATQMSKLLGVANDE